MAAKNASGFFFKTLLLTFLTRPTVNMTMKVKVSGHGNQGGLPAQKTGDRARHPVSPLHPFTPV